MKKYLQQLLSDITYATQNVPNPYYDKNADLEIEVNHIKKKYGSDYMKYYPYHLDADYDDEHGNPWDYGFGKMEDDEDDWWKK